jgi:hypothetical protein
MDQHRFWDGVITSSSNLNVATALRNRQEFQRSQLTELANSDFDRGLKRASRLRQRSLIDMGGWIGISKGGNKDMRDGWTGFRASCGLRA